MKGPLVSGGLIRVASIGGVLGDLALIVPGSPKFEDGEEVLLFLVRGRDDQWHTTDLTLGKFKHVLSTRGEKLLVRDDEEIFGWDVEGRPHREPIRLAEPFLRFVRDVAAGAPAVENYFAPLRTTFSRPQSESMTFEPAPTATYPASTYVKTLTLNGITRPIRWPSFGSGVAFRNYGTQAGAPNNGIDAIVAGAAMWTNDCGSAVSYSYAGATGTAQCMNTPLGGDGIHGVSFNDPCGEIPGSWSGSGTLGQGSYWINSDTNTLNGEVFWNIIEANVVLQDNLQAWRYVGSAAYMNTLLAHEIGHTLGFRHSDQNPAGGSCDPAAMECSSAAVMVAVLQSPFNALQTWDVNAVRAVYPGGSCGVPGAKKRADFNGNGTSDIWWRNTSTGANSIWYTTGSGFAGGATAPSVGSVAVFTGTGDFNNDGRADVLWRNTTNGSVSVWLMNGGALVGGLTLPSVSVSHVNIVGIGDFNGDGYADVLWRNSQTGANSIWYVTASGFAGGAEAPVVSDQNMEVAAVADFNADGRSDILWRHRVAGTNYTWLMNGGAIIGGVQLPTVPSSLTMAGTGDFNGDGAFDLVWRNPSTGDNSIWYLSNGAFAGGVGLPTVVGSAVNIAAVGDFNGDGRYDLLWRNASSGDNSIWFINSGFIGGVGLPSIAGSAVQIVAPE